MQIDFEQIRQGAEEADQQKKEAMKEAFEKDRIRQEKKAEELMGLMRKAHEQEVARDEAELERQIKTQKEKEEQALIDLYNHQHPHRKETAIDNAWKNLISTLGLK